MGTVAANLRDWLQQLVKWFDSICVGVPNVIPVHHQYFRI